MKTVLSASLLLLSLSTSAAEPAIDQAQPTREIHLDASQTAANQDAMTAPSAITTNQDFSSSAWFDSIDLKLRYDLDEDGFYSQLYVRFDAHTQYAEQPVYAVYRLDDGYQYRTIYTSTIFSLYGASRGDAFAIETDMTSIPRGYYLLQIQLRDARSGALLAEISGYSAAALDDLPLESVSADLPPPVVVVEETSGGSLGISALLALSWLYWRRRTT